MLVSNSKHIRPKSKKRARPGPRTSLLTRPARQTLVLSFVLVIVTVVLYYPAIHHPFVNYDDGGYVSNNVHVQSGLTWEMAEWPFTTYDENNWHPVTWLSHALDCQLFQSDPTGHHSTNVLLHALNVVLLFWILLQATGFTGRSFMVAALFAVHPINVESVVWIAERKNLLSMLFFLLALGVYRWYAREPRAGRYAAVAILFALGLMAKPQIITLPFVLLLWDYWPLRRMLAGGQPHSTTAIAFPGKNFSWLLLEKVPLVALSAASAAITIEAQRVAGGINPVSPSARLANAIVSYARYAGKAFWPTRLAPMYPHPGNSLAGWHVLATSLFLLVITALVAAGRRHRYLPVGWLWFLGTLIPMIGLVQVGRQAMADRYAYLPFIGLFIMMCWAVPECLAASGHSLDSRRDQLTDASAHAVSRRQPISAILLATVCVGVLVLLIVVAHRQIDYWSDNVKLWSHTLQVTNRNYEAEEYLGEVLVANGEQAEALVHFYQAIAIDPSRMSPYMYIAVYDQEHGKLQEAIKQYRIAASLAQTSSGKANALGKLGRAYLELGNAQQARETLQQAVTLDPHKMELWIDLGLAKQKSGDVPGAIEAYSEGTKVQASDVGYLLLARVLEQGGRQEEAAMAIQRAKALSGNFAEAQRVSKRLLGQ